ncbi:MAG: hypothetical protein ACOC6A_02580 [Chloroflexota bacterium]
MEAGKEGTDQFSKEQPDTDTKGQGAEAGEDAQQGAEAQKEPEEAGKEEQPTEAQKLAVIDQNPDLEDPRLYSSLQEPDWPPRDSRRAEESQPPPTQQAQSKEPAPEQPAEDQTADTGAQEGDSTG